MAKDLPVVRVIEIRVMDSQTNQILRFNAKVPNPDMGHTFAEVRDTLHERLDGALDMIEKTLK